MSLPNATEIRAVRRYGLNLNQRELAEFLGVTRRTVEYWEAGAHRMDATTWRAMTRGLQSCTKPDPLAIRRARRVANLTQRAASERLGVPMRTWQFWEDSQRAMPGVKWALFLELCGLPREFSTSTRLLNAPVHFYG